MRRLRLGAVLHFLIAIITIVVLYSLRALAGGNSCIHDFTWLQFFSSLIPAIIAWCYWPAIELRSMALTLGNARMCSAFQSFNRAIRHY